MPSPHTGIGDKNESFQKNVILYKKCPRRTKFSVEFVYVTWFLFFRWIVLLFHDSHHMNVGMHTRPKLILYIFVQLKCWTQALTDFVAFRLLSTGWYTCQSLLETTKLAESLRGDWIPADTDAARGSEAASR